MDRRELFTSFTSRSRPAPSESSLGPKFYTNALLRTHEGQEVRFYDDLIKGKHVVINLMYANCQGACTPVTARLRKLQDSLGDRVGRDIFMYSITLKPEEDGPEQLKAYAEKHDVKPGWLFLTGDPFDITTIKFRLMRWRHPGRDLKIAQHSRMIRVINDSINRWTGCSALASLDTIKQVISFAEPQKSYDEMMRENAIVQAKIDSLETLPTWLGALAD